MKKMTCLWFILILFISCNEKNCKKYFYQNSRSIKKEHVYEIKGDTTFYYLTTYYKEGQLSSKGQVKKLNKIGFWQEWHADGSLKWEGNYENNRRIFKLPVSNVKVILMETPLKKEQVSYLRVIVDGIHPNDVIIGCNNGIIKNSDNKSISDFMVKPNHSGKIIFEMFVRDNEKTIIIGKDSMNVME